MTVAEAARRLGVGRPALSNLLNGHAALSADMAKRLARTFGADAGDLLDRQARYDASGTAPRHAPVSAPFAPPAISIRAAEIDAWADSIEARQRLPVLLRHLVNATGARLARVDFPGYDNSERRGWDGWVQTAVPTAWIPEGSSGWECGCSREPARKAEEDFRARSGLPGTDKETLSFVFVTPRVWPTKKDWESSKRGLDEWKDVRAYDASDLEQWIEQSIPAQVWFAEQIGKSGEGLVSPEEYWRRWSAATNPPLTRKLFTPTVERFSAAFRKWLENPDERRFTIAADSRMEAVALVTCLLDDLGYGHEFSQRGVVFETAAAVERLVNSTPGAFVAIAATPEAEGAFHKFKRALHCVVPVPRNGIWSAQNEADIALGALGLSQFMEAMREMGLSHDAADRLERDSGRSPTVLRRRLSALPEIAAPKWATADAARMLGPISLVGAWNTASEADRSVVCRLVGRQHEHVERVIAEASGLDDPPVWRVGEYRGVVSRLDSFFATVDSWTPELVERFFQVAEDVLSERDPALDLPEGDQWMAALHGKERSHSEALRKGLREGLVILAVHGPRALERRFGGSVTGEVASRVRNLLEPFDLDHLRSLDADLPDLAEAAPEVFLAALEVDLSSESSAAKGLMRPEESDPLMGGCRRAGLLWALERLAWEPDYYEQVVKMLARLSSVEIDDNWANTPESSLHSLFHAYLPQTSVPMPDRLGVLRRLATEDPEVAWSLALSNESHERFGFLMPSQRPAWRGDAAADRGSARPSDVQGFLRASRSLCLDWRGHDSGKLGDLVECCPEWDDEDQKRVVALIQAWMSAHPAEDERAALAERIRNVRRRVSAEDHALSARLASLQEQLTPMDPIARHRWLFESQWDPIYAHCDTRGDMEFEEAEEAIRTQREHALIEILATRGAKGVSSLLETSGAPESVGELLPDLLRDSDDRLAFVLLCLDKKISGRGDHHGACLRSFLWRQDAKVIRTLWSEITAHRSPPVRQQFLQVLRYRSAALLLSNVTADVRTEYWRRFQANEHYSPSDKNELIDGLLEAKRPGAAFGVVTGNWDAVESSRLVRLLKALAEDLGSLEASGWRSRDLFLPFKSLAARADILDDEKAGLELRFFALLRHSRHPMRYLARRIAASPVIFVEAIARIFRRSDDAKDPPELWMDDADHRRALARAAFQMLGGLDGIAGAEDAGRIGPGNLRRWGREARSRLRRLGRVEIGDQRIGRLLAAASADESGVWPRREVCKALQDVATKELEIGFVAGGLQRRGVWTRAPEEGGDQERDLAARHRAWAASVAPEFPFVAGALREIAKQYDHQAGDMDTRAELEQRGVK